MVATSGEQPDVDWITALVTRTYAEHLTAMEFGVALKAHINNYGCTEQQMRLVASTLLRFATASSVPERRLLQCLETLVKAEVLRWAVFIEVIAEFRHFSRVPCVETLAVILQNSVPLLRCSYTSERECAELSAALITVLNWCLLALEYSLKNDTSRGTQALIKCTCAYAESKFVRAMLYLHERIGGDSVNYVVEAAISFSQSYPACEELKTMTESLRRIGTSPVEKIDDNLCGLIKQLDAKESLGEELVASQAFFYVKLPQIVKHLLALGAPITDLTTALATICDNKTLLNQVDMKTKTNTLQHLLEQMAAAGVIDDVIVKNLLEKRFIFKRSECLVYTSK
ncbi:unnamed protein product [Toxocara canis]|uniref:Mediator of RNA polymerase II transcription subunit 24 n=1 Tax=Toxocara canis TaxID=6265 RepID=A0A183VG12_TOXCA|nr:unnamed protein product [Toxocara canis]